MNPNELYQYYLNAYGSPQSMDSGIASVAPIASFQDSGQGIATLRPTTGTSRMPTFFGMTPGQYARSYVNNPANILGTLASYTLGPVPGFLTTQAALAAQRKGIIPENFTGMFGGNLGKGGVDLDALAGDLGYSDGTTSASDGGEAGAAAAEAAGANDDADTGGPF